MTPLLHSWFHVQQFLVSNIVILFGWIEFAWIVSTGIELGWGTLLLWENGFDAHIWSVHLNYEREFWVRVMEDGSRCETWLEFCESLLNCSWPCEMGWASFSHGCKWGGYWTETSNEVSVKVKANPKNHCNSFKVVGCGQSRTALTFLSSIATPFWLMM